MITIIHGDDIVTSRIKLNELIESNSSSEIIRFDGSKLTNEQILIASESNSIISPEKLIIVEGFLSVKKSLEKDNVEKFLLKSTPAVSIIIWESKELDKLTHNKFKGSRIFNFPLPKLLWRFLDSIGVIATADLLSMFHTVIKTYEVNFIFAMIIRQWHNLLLAKNSQDANSSGLASWQVGKLRNQERSINAPLLNTYRRLIAIDYQNKSGQTPLNLKEQLDIFFINL